MCCFDKQHLATYIKNYFIQVFLPQLKNEVLYTTTKNGEKKILLENKNFIKDFCKTINIKPTER